MPFVVKVMNRLGQTLHFVGSDGKQVANAHIARPFTTPEQAEAMAATLRQNGGSANVYETEAET